MTVRHCGMCKTQHDFCDSCRIGIGKKHREETDSIQVGQYVLCPTCSSTLQRKGRVEIDRYGEGNFPMITWLHKDGSVTKKRANFSV